MSYLYWEFPDDFNVLNIFVAISFIGFTHEICTSYQD